MAGTQDWDYEGRQVDPLTPADMAGFDPDDDPGMTPDDVFELDDGRELVYVAGEWYLLMNDGRPDYEAPIPESDIPSSVVQWQRNLDEREASAGMGRR